MGPSFFLQQAESAKCLHPTQGIVHGPVEFCAGVDVVDAHHQGLALRHEKRGASWMLFGPATSLEAVIGHDLAEVG